MSGINMPARKDKMGLLETVLTGVKIVRDVYGIKEAAEASERLDAELKMKQDNAAAELGERSRMASGRLNKREQLELGAKGYVSAEPGQKPDFSGTDHETGGVLGYVKKQNAPAIQRPVAVDTLDDKGRPVTKFVTPKEGDTFAAQPKKGAGGLSIPKKTDEEKAGAKSVADVAKNFEADYAKKTQISNVMDRELEKFKKLMDEGRTDEAVRHGEGMLKALNSAFGADAVGTEEAKRLGGFLQAFKAPWEPGSMVGRDLDLFYNQVLEKSSAIRGAATDSLTEAKKIRGGGFEALDPGGPVAQPMAPKESGTATAAPAALPEGPKPGTVENGFEYLGGNPADPKSWRQVADAPDRPGASTRGGK